MENKLFTVTYDMLTKKADVHYCPEAVISCNSIKFSKYPDILIHVYADNEKKALEIARIDIQNQLYILSKDIDRAMEEKISEKVYIIRYNDVNGGIEFYPETEFPVSVCPNNINKVYNITTTVFEVAVAAPCKREAKGKALDLISEYFSDKAKKAVERKKVVEEFDDED